MSIATIIWVVQINKASERSPGTPIDVYSHVLRSKDELLPNHQRVFVNVEVIEYVQPVLL